MPRDATAPAFDSEFEHEEVTLFRDSESGLAGCIAVHSTALGPAMGGLRLSTYGGLDAAVTDALALSRTMTLKNAAAGLDLGGGKAVLVDDRGWSDPHSRQTRMRAFAARLDRLDGRYVTAEDVGTTPEDMDLLAEVTAHVAGRSTTSGDPSAATARTVFAAIVDAVALQMDSTLDPLTVGVLGVGNVGARLVELLTEANAVVTVADINTERAAAVARAHGCVAVPLSRFWTRPFDVVAPCALGGVITPDVANRMSCRVVAGAANNPVSSPAVAQRLHERGILYVPDFLANCGGIIHVGADVLGFDDDDVNRRILACVGRTRIVLEEARAQDVPPDGLARRIAAERLAAAPAAAVS